MDANCLDDHEVAALVDGDVSDAGMRRAQIHAARCDACRGMLALVGRLRALEDAPSAGADTLPAKPPPIAFEPGDRLRRYEIVGELGRGAMGIVFEAHDPRLDRRVALKVMQHGDEEQLSRISREAQAVAALSHPNVVQIFDAGLADARAFIVMELVEGCALDAWLSQQPRSWRRILEVHEAAGRGLAAAHAAGLVHRDFKPANVLVGPHGGVKVLDFGLARPVGAPTRSDPPCGSEVPNGLTLTATGMAVGTPIYMAPEQHRGERVGEKADIYAFGVTLYRALYGRLPFQAGTMEELLLAKKGENPPRPQGTDVPRRVHEAICCALAYDPGQRWGSMDAFLDELRRIRTQRRRGAAAAGVAILAVGLAAAAFHVIGGPAGPDASFAGELRNHADRALAQARLDEGRALLAMDENDEAIVRLQESLDRAAALGDDALQLDAALQLIDVNAALERTDAALEAGSLARALAERTHASPDRVVDLLGSEAMALPLERRADRVQRLEEALAICREHPGQFEGALASVLSNLSNALPVAEADRAHALAMEALEIRQRLAVDSDDGATDGAEVVVAQAEGMRGDFEACVRRAAGVYGRAERPLIRARAARAVAVCMTDLGDPAGAVPWADRSLDEAARTHSRDSLQYAEKLEFKGALLARANEYEAAAAADQQAVAILEVQSRRPSNRVAMAYVNLSTTLQKLGEHRRAEVYARKGLEEAEAVDDPALVRDAHVAMGEALGNIGRYAEAIRHLEVAAGDPPYDERALVARAVYAVAMWNTGRREAGMRIARETASQLEDGKSSSTRQALENWIEKHAGSVATGDQVDLRQPAAGAIEGDAGAAAP